MIIQAVYSFFFLINSSECVELLVLILLLAELKIINTVADFGDWDILIGVAEHLKEQKICVLTKHYA